MSTLTPNSTLIEIGKRMKLERARLGMKSIEVSVAVDIHLNTYSYLKAYEINKLLLSGCFFSY